jgi:hypothetical protein
LIEECAVLVVFRTIVLVVVCIVVPSNWLRLRVVEVLLVERSNTLSTLRWILFWVIRRQRAHDGQSVVSVAKFVDS